MAFSSMLKKLREQRNLSQKDIAQYLGVTRQAVASYELAKREPDYEILRKLADFYGVSVDYLLGRTENNEINTAAIGSNIDIIRGKLTYKGLSEDIRKKTGALVFPEMLELYAKGARSPFIGTIKILAKYAQVSDNFFYRYNTAETYEREKQLFRKEALRQEALVIGSSSREALDFMDEELYGWVADRDNLGYLRFAMLIQQRGVKIDELKRILDLE